MKQLSMSEFQPVSLGSSRRLSLAFARCSANCRLISASAHREIVKRNLDA